MKRAFSRRNLWEAIPLPIRGRLGVAAGLISPRYLLGARFRRCLAFAREAQYWPAERSRAYQLEQLRQILMLASHTPYYQRVFASVGFQPGDLQRPEDIQGLPLIDKHTLREHIDDMCARSVASADIDCVSTGGTSGKPLRFYIDSGRSAVEYAYLVASWERAGYRLTLPQAVLRGMIVAPRGDGLRHQYDPVLRRHYYSNFHLNVENARHYLAHMRTIGPCYLHAYPSSAATLAGIIERLGERPPANFRGLLVGSENVYEDQRRQVERVLGVRMFSWYGHSEKLVLAAECERSSAYHVWPTYGFCELVDDEGKAATRVGQRGQIVGTGFINRVVPFIRYATGDYATLGGERCRHCGREQLILESVEGRWPQGNLTAADGSAVSMTTLNFHDDTFENVLDYQFRQSGPGRATLCIVPAGEFSAEQRERLLGRLHARLQHQVRLELRICSELEKTGMGKQPRVVQERNGAVHEGTANGGARTPMYIGTRTGGSENSCAGGSLEREGVR